MRSIALNSARWWGAGVERYTPRSLFRALHEEFAFTLDPCATSESAVVPRFFTREDNGLEQPWGGERVFCNPPYGRGIYDWLRKAFTSARDDGALVVLLVPSATDSSWWHDYVLYAEVRWIRGRVKFLREGMRDDGGHAPHASCIVIFRPGEQREPMPVLRWARAHAAITDAQTELL